MSATNKLIQLRFNGAPEYAYFAVFLGFICYQFLVFNGYISNFFGGGFAALLLLSLPFLLIKQFSEWNNYSGLSAVRFLWVIFLTIFCIYLIYGFYAEKNQIILLSNVLALLRYVVIYLIFKNLKIQSRSVKLASIYCVLFAFFLVLFSGAAIHSETIELEESLFSLRNDFQIDYQSIGALVLISYFIAIEKAKINLRILLFGATLFTLLGCGARFELLAFLIGVLLREVKVLGLLNFGAIFLAASLVGLFIFSIALLTLSGDLSFANFRIFQIIEDGSIGDRMDLFYGALDLIKKNYFLGDYAGYDPGAYAHNIISAWVDTGFIGFIIALMIHFACLAISIRMVVLKRNVAYYFPFLIAFVACLAAFFSKHYTNLYFPVMIGSLVHYFSIPVRGSRD